MIIWSHYEHNKVCEFFIPYYIDYHARNRICKIKKKKAKERKRERQIQQLFRSGGRDESPKNFHKVRSYEATMLPRANERALDRSTCRNLFIETQVMK